MRSSRHAIEMRSTSAQMQMTLNTEFGGLPEALANLYTITGADRYLAVGAQGERLPRAASSIPTPSRRCGPSWARGRGNAIS